jgi:cell division protein FtsB
MAPPKTPSKRHASEGDAVDQQASADVDQVAENFLTENKRLEKFRQLLADLKYVLVILDEEGGSLEVRNEQLRKETEELRAKNAALEREIAKLKEKKSGKK